MIDVSFLAAAMEHQGITSQAQLSRESGVSTGGISRLLKRGECTRAVATKLQAVLDEPIGPHFGPEDVAAYSPGGDEPEGRDRDPRTDGYDVSDPLPVVSPEVALAQYEGDDCPTSSHFCRGCYRAVREELGALDAPMTRATCRTLHRWAVVPGEGLVYQGPEGRLGEPDPVAS